MQRVATELDAALSDHDGVEYSSIVLRSSWKWTHVRTGPFLGRALLQIRSAVRRGDVDVVLFSSMVTAALVPLLRSTLRRHGVASAAIVHGRDVTLSFEPYQRLVGRIFSALDAVFPVSQATGDACLARGLQPYKLHVVPNGVSVSRFTTRGSHLRARQMLFDRFDRDGTTGSEGLLLCSVGRQVKRKGYAWFVDSVMPLLPPDVTYLLAGDGPETERIAAAAEARGIRDRVRLLGRVSEETLELLYLGADLFVMPNIPVAGDMEGFGVVMLEAGLCGLPTVASRLEGITDVVEEGENGHLVESGDAWEFSEAIMQYYHEPALLQAARRAASRYVTDHFSWKAVADKYVDALRRYVPSDRIPEEAGVA